MEEVKRPPDPPAREKSDRQIEMERIEDEYDKKHGKGIYAESTDPDSDEAFLDPEEKRALYNERLKQGDSPLDQARGTRERVYSKSLPETEEVEPDYDDGRPVYHRSLDSFIEKNPKYAKESVLKEVFDTACQSLHDDVRVLREKFNRTNDRADGEALFARAADIHEIAVRERNRRAAVEEAARERFRFRGM